VKKSARFFKALADEARLKMLWLLFNNRELCVCEVMEVLEITQSKASRHLATLRHAGLVTDRREGIWAYYSICPVEGALQRTQVESLKAELGKLPEASQLLQKYRGCVARKESKASCTMKPSRPKSTAKERPTSRRAQLSGGSR